MQTPDKDGFIEVSWPSKAVPHGGLFHPQRAEYSKGTREFLKLLIEETKLTILQKQRLAWCLRGGERKSSDATRVAEEFARDAPRRPKTSRRRSLSTIAASGDYVRERWRPIHRAEDREELKKRFQDIMEFGRDYKKPRERVKQTEDSEDTKGALPNEEDQLADLINQIQERAQWLEEMESLGEGAKYREMIRDQIAQRLRHIEELNLNEPKVKVKQRRQNESARKNVKATNANVGNLKVDLSARGQKTSAREENVSLYSAKISPNREPSSGAGTRLSSRSSAKSDSLQTRFTQRRSNAVHTVAKIDLKTPPKF